MTRQDNATIEAMSMFGGGFAEALAAACYRADGINLAKIKAAFPELWQQYTELAATRNQQARRANGEGATTDSGNMNYPPA